jgi:starch-binding outer membrane protein, SusD/RagB family
MRYIPTGRRAVAATVAVLASAAAIGACDSVKNNLLEAKDPDIIDPSAVQSPNGAVAVRLGALSRLRLMTTGSGNAGTEGTWLLGGLLADEWSTSSTFVQNDETDERQISLSNSSVDGSLRAIYRVPTAANLAIGLLTKFRPTPASDIAEMYFARGFAEAQLASDFCNGIPLSDATGTTVAFGKPLSDSEIFTIASASYDTAITMSSATDAATVTINRAARIGKARALLGLNDPANAALLVAGIPTTFTYDATSSLTGGNNGIWNQGFSQRRYNVGDSLEGNAHNILVPNAIPFFSAKDPRVPSTYTISSKGDTTKGQDGATFSRTTSMYGQTSDVALVNGIDARLVEAEAALRANNPAGMITILNALRATPIVLVPPSPNASGTHPGLTTPVMAPLVDPGTPDGRINLLFREKAFWTFSRGQRLGDMRRLIRQYNRTPDQVFTTGPHYRGATYGADVNLPITTGESNGNPNFSQCTDRKA